MNTDAKEIKISEVITLDKSALNDITDYDIFEELKKLKEEKEKEQ